MQYPIKTTQKCNYTISVNSVEEMVEIIEVTFLERVNDQIGIEWFEPVIGFHSVWTPQKDSDKGFDYEWENGETSWNTCGAPVLAFTDLKGFSLMTIAAKETCLPVRIRHGIQEESATAHIMVIIEGNGHYLSDRTKFFIRIDRRKQRISKALEHVNNWWDSNEVVAPPSAAREAAYSTWYSFHQQIEEDVLISECKEAVRLGMKTIIVDDGWQTADDTRGYANCGDWQPLPTKFPDMKRFVDRVHQLGMKAMIWFSVPFVGSESSVFNEFKQFSLRYDYDRSWDNPERGWLVVDPRVPLVRKYIIKNVSKAVKEWGYDGVKLDFIDEFIQNEDSPAFNPICMDCEFVEIGANILLKELSDELKSIHPDALIEFRQKYIGPNMRQFGNIFRATDCPNNLVYNKIRTLDLRLLSGNTAVHSDMIMWNMHESAEEAALQFAAVIFSIPQVSVQLSNLPESHRIMIKWWLTFIHTYIETLQFGILDVAGVESGYTSATASDTRNWVHALYGSNSVSLPSKEYQTLVVVNGANDREIFLDTRYIHNTMKCTLKDAYGAPISSFIVDAGEIKAVEMSTASTLFFEAAANIN